MTIICIKDGVIAADTGAFCGCVLVETAAEKIVHAADGAVGASTGDAGATHAFRGWFLNSIGHRRTPGGYPLTFEKDSGFDCVWLEPDGEIWRMDFSGRPFRVFADLVAIGSPYEMAFGAMLAGASAAEAVALCIKHHAFAAGEVVTARCEPPAEAAAEEPLYPESGWREKLGLTT
jgi:hypothetical protein